MNERLLSILEVGEVIGNHPNDVRKLIHDGRLSAKRQIVRGRGGRPRLKVLWSEVERYMRELDDARPDEKTERAPKAKTRRSKLTGVIEFV